MIKIPNNRAIQLLEARLSEASDIKTDLSALKTRLQADVEAIFGRGSTQIISVIGLNTSHFSTDETQGKYRETFKQTIKGFINYIQDFHLIDQEKLEISEQEYKTKYENLLAKWNKLVPDYNELLKNYESVTAKYDASLSQIRILEERYSGESKITDFIKILFLGASPIDEVRIRIDEELRDIEYGLKLASLRDQFELKSKWAVTTKVLQQAMLDEHPAIVHFSGHGDTYGIAVEDYLGNAKLIDAQALGSLFELFSETTKCVLLNSCYTQSQAEEIKKYVPYVIGMKSSVDDKAAIAFSVGFYTALGAGKDIEFAFKMGTVAVKLEGIDGSDLPILLR